MAGPRFDLQGHRFGRLKVRRFLEMRRHTAYWECVCKCGAKTIVRGTHLRCGQTRSCGCLNREISKSVAARMKYKHGGASDIKGRHALHARWRNMRARCNNPRGQTYHRYGGRGIKVCARWDDFELFVKDVGMPPEHPSDQYKRYWSLDRIDNDGNYEPGNVRWATPKQQACNKTKHDLSGDGA